MVEFNFVDWVIIITLLFFAFEALTRPLILELLDFISFLLASFLSFSFFNFPAKFLEIQFRIPHGLSLVLGFMSVWFISETIFYLLVRIILPKIPNLNFLGSKVLSILPATLRGLVFIALTLVMIATFPIQPRIKKAVMDSQIGSQILHRAYALEKPVKNVFGGITSESLTFLTIKPQTDETVNLGFQTTQFSVDEQIEFEMIELLNKERTDRGLKPLKFNESLREVARAHSADMFSKGYFSHYSPQGETVADRATQFEVDFLVIGENLAYAPSLELAHKGLMDSKGHRENILSDDYGQIGIGVMDGGVYEKMFTQVFSN